MNQSHFIGLAALSRRRAEIRRIALLVIQANEDELVDVERRVTKRVTPPRLTSFVQSVIPKFYGNEFQSHFRMMPETAEALENLISPQISKNSLLGTGRNTIKPRTQILAVLWLLATPDSYRSMGQQFGLSKRSLHGCFRRMYKAINQYAAFFIKWPTQKEVVKQKFRAIAGMPDVIGAIDGCHVEIETSEVQPSAYRTDKKTHAITLQAVCDADLKFTDVFAGFPGSVYDARVLVNSPLYRDHDNIFEGNEFIVGDKAYYPIQLWLIPPYKDTGNLTQAQINFNKVLSSTRQVIERAFCLLKGRFRRLKHLLMFNTHEIAPTILACCVLHNICLSREGAAVINQYIEEGRPEIFQHGQPEPEDGAEEQLPPNMAATSKIDYLRDLLMNH